MKKLKCYVLIVSEKFPKTHPRKGESTDFPIKIKHYKKLHTIRLNFELWEKRMEEIQKGNAYLSVRVWTGKPYQSKQKEIFQYTSSSGIGIQRLNIWEDGSISIDELEKPKLDVTTIAKNDGLTFDDFYNWFHKIKFETLGIIHFTEFRY